MNAVTYSIFDNTGNLIDWFDDRAAAVEYLSCIGRANPDVADDVFLVAEDGDGNLGEVVLASSVSITPS